MALLKMEKSFILRPPFLRIEIKVDFLIFGGLLFQAKLKVISVVNFFLKIIWTGEQ